jgi:threonylcarbamoyladenosine tRNA methylthiotransferase MtaB
MNRQYTTRDYRIAVNNIRKFVPDVSITTDIIVGFPGESNDEFEKSYQFCKDVSFAAMHIFVYSPRPDTLAAIMQDQVKSRIKKERSLRMLELAKSSAGLYASKFINREMRVLWESEVDAGAGTGTGVYSGLTDNYMRVFTKNARCLINEVTPVRLARIYEDGFWGDLIN